MRKHLTFIVVLFLFLLGSELRVKFLQTVFIELLMIWVSVFLSLFVLAFKSPSLSLSPHPHSGSPLSCIHTEPVLRWLPCIEARQCGHSASGLSGPMGPYWERTFL